MYWRKKIAELLCPLWNNLCRETSSHGIRLAGFSLREGSLVVLIFQSHKYPFSRHIVGRDPLRTHLSFPGLLSGPGAWHRNHVKSVGSSSDITRSTSGWRGLVELIWLCGFVALEPTAEVDSSCVCVPTAQICACQHIALYAYNWWNASHQAIHLIFCFWAPLPFLAFAAEIWHACILKLGWRKENGLYYKLNV